MAQKISPERRVQIGKEKRARTRATILSAAFDLLGRPHGRSTRIEEVCLAATVSRGTFYNYFSDIDELFEVLTYEMSHEFNIAVQELMQTLPNCAMRVALAIRYYLHRARQDRSWGWAMVNLSSVGPIFGADTFQYATASVQEGVSSGEFQVQSVKIGRDMMIGTVLASMTTLLREEQEEDYPEKVVRQILSAFLVPASIIDVCVEIELLKLPLKRP
ncbi:TetR/AcrR family transcriptional regulator [Rhizobium hainanense]|uniref:Transcriptional regulator, TetR family n=1 Tax=Rhizobium hainanense TaxID=52131 RepID=A0A1C3WK20_9HYPH|nr:TetR/AcrR family transcriptional regulator [Rhizobium hainanense]SCB40300.1 transcriptional regulator, TetR family [Rhizobium hainanense]